MIVLEKCGEEGHEVSVAILFVENYVVVRVVCVERVE